MCTVVIVVHQSFFFLSLFLFFFFHVFSLICEHGVFFGGVLPVEAPFLSVYCSK